MQGRRGPQATEGPRARPGTAYDCLPIRSRPRSKIGARILLRARCVDEFLPHVPLHLIKANREETKQCEATMSS